MSLEGCKGGVYLQAFGVFTWECARPRDVMSFPEGVQQGLFQKGGRSSFRRAIFEVLAYLEVSCVVHGWVDNVSCCVLPVSTRAVEALGCRVAGPAMQDGELPEAMTPLNNDEGFSSDNEDDIAGYEALAGKQNETADFKVTDKLTGLHPSFSWDTCQRSPAARGKQRKPHDCFLAFLQ